MKDGQTGGRAAQEVRGRVKSEEDRAVNPDD